jgi:hypothetical protein
LFAVLLANGTPRTVSTALLAELESTSVDTFFGAFSVRLALGELVYALVRQSKQSGGITGAHLQASSAQDTHGSSSRLGGAPVFVVGLLAERHVCTKRPRCVGRQLHLVDDLRRS